MHILITRYQGYIGAALVLGGIDVTGPHLYSIYPHGSTDKLPYVTMGECTAFVCVRIFLWSLEGLSSVKGGGALWFFDSFSKYLMDAYYGLHLDIAVNKNF